MLRISCLLCLRDEITILNTGGLYKDFNKNQLSRMFVRNVDNLIVESAELIKTLLEKNVIKPDIGNDIIIKLCCLNGDVHILQYMFDNYNSYIDIH